MTLTIIKALVTFCLVATIVAMALFIYNIHFAVWSIVCTGIGFGLNVIWKVKPSI
jgi:hypothetical protein